MWKAFLCGVCKCSFVTYTDGFQQREVNSGPRHTKRCSQAFLSCCLRSFLLLLHIQEALWAHFTEDVP